MDGSVGERKHAIFRIWIEKKDFYKRKTKEKRKLSLSVRNWHIWRKQVGNKSQDLFGSMQVTECQVLCID